MSIEVTNIDRMSKEIASSAAILSSNEARYLVDAYYITELSKTQCCAALNPCRLESTG